MIIKAGNRAARIFAFILAITLLTALSPSARADGRELVPMGCTVGIQMRTEGVVVVGLSEVAGAEGTSSPAGEAGVMPGDVIKKLGGREISSAAEFLEETGLCGGREMTLTVERRGVPMQFTARPRQAQDGVYKLGLWLRDSVSGIGTVTFYDPATGRYGALGHSISDIDTGIMLPLASGNILRSEIIGVRPGAAGTPGELCGRFDENERLGSIEKNTAQGIFGTMEAADGFTSPVSIGHRDEIAVGPATILSNISGTEVQEFSVEISRVYGGDENRSLMLSVTDPDLLAATGGIVQGMSGSPILQNGRLIGAVTHVLVNDPRSGYGISIDSMLETDVSDTAFGYAA